MKLTFENNLKTCMRHLVVRQIVCKRHRILPLLFLTTEWTQWKPSLLLRRRRYNKNRAIIALRSIADHCACTTAWSQRSWSFDPPVRTGDVIKVKSCALARPVSSRPVEKRYVWTRALGIRHAKRKHRVILTTSAYLSLPYFSILSHKQHEFREKNHWT